MGKLLAVRPVGNGDALLQDAHMHLFDLWVVACFTTFMDMTTLKPLHLYFNSEEDLSLTALLL